MVTNAPRAVVVALPGGAQARVRISLETERLVASILDTQPTPAVYKAYLERMLAKLADESAEPYLVDVELALLDDLLAVPGVDGARLEAARAAWTEAYGRLLPTAQKGAATLTRALRIMFAAVTQAEFEKKVSALIEALSDEERVPALEFAEELMTSLCDVVEAGETEWNAHEMDYIDNHIYYQLYCDIVRPAIDVRGKTLAARRLNILSGLLKTFQF